MSKRQIREFKMLMALPVRQRAEKIGLKVIEIVTAFGTLIIWK